VTARGHPASDRPPRDYAEALARRAARKRREAGDRGSSSADSWRCPVKGGQGKPDATLHSEGLAFSVAIALAIAVVSVFVAVAVIIHALGGQAS
jgi:hypothetical protein